MADGVIFKEYRGEAGFLVTCTVNIRILLHYSAKVLTYCPLASSSATLPNYQITNTEAKAGFTVSVAYQPTFQFHPIFRPTLLARRQIAYWLPAKHINLYRWKGLQELLQLSFIFPGLTPFQITII
jgi:hypothetical protein